MELLTLDHYVILCVCVCVYYVCGGDVARQTP
jgi:hypothetical protein